MFKIKRHISQVLILAISVSTLFFSSITASANVTEYINSDFTGATVNTYQWWRDVTINNNKTQSYVDEGNNRVVQIKNDGNDTATSGADYRGFFRYQATTGVYGTTTYTKGISILEMDFKIDGTINAHRYLLGGLVSVYYNAPDYDLTLGSFGGGSKIGKVQKGTWYKIKVIFDTTTNTYLAAYFGTLENVAQYTGAITGAAVTPDFTGTNIATMQQISANATQSIFDYSYLYLDNVKFYRPSTFALATTPSNNATQVGVNAPISIVFDNEMSEATLTAANLRLENSDTCAITESSFSYNQATKTLVITPNTPLNSETNYNIRITPNVKDIYGQGFAQDTIYTFRTELTNLMEVQDITCFEGIMTTGIPLTAIKSGSISSKIQVKNVTGVVQALTVVTVLVKKVDVSETFQAYTLAQMNVPTGQIGTFNSAITVPISQSGEEYFLRYYFWDTINDMNAYASNRIFGKDGLVNENN